MKNIRNQEFGGERPLYMSSGISLENVTILPGESAIKESSEVVARNCVFDGKYVFWENRGTDVTDSVFRKGARSSFWYGGQCRIARCEVEAPKMFRRMKDIGIEDCRFTDAQETLWDCDGIRIRDSYFSNADYLGMHCSDVKVDGCRIDGNYAWQYGRNVEIRDSVLNSKDALWESENVTVYDSVIIGEYLGWYSRNLRLVRCRLGGTQLLCYCSGLVLEDCSFAPDADLVFEYSTVRASILGNVTSVKNPTSGYIKISAGNVGDVIIDSNIKGPGATIEIC